MGGVRGANEGIEGIQCDLVACETGDGAVIMTNIDRVGQLVVQILHVIAREYGWSDFPVLGDTRLQLEIEVGPFRS